MRSQAPSSTAATVRAATCARARAVVAAHWRPSASCRRNAPAVCSAQAQQGTATAPAATEAEAAFAGLAAATLDRCAVSLQPCQQGNGLFLTTAAAQGDVVLSIPLSCCLVVDYVAGMQLPPGQWSRLRRGVQQDDALPWDMLQALAVLDSLSGAGDAFWERYSNAILPQPLELTLPFCFPPELLPELQHGAIIAGARAQQGRLAGLFPALAGSMCEGGPSWFQWAFACVRSRAFKLKDECFAFVPFLDIANHAADPSCDFRLSSDGSCVEMVALKDVAAGQEATISYTGPEGLTNQRLMAQYGFVPPHGNTADRLQFAALEAAAAGASSSSSSSSPVATLLSLDRLQACLGDGQQMVAALGGKDPYAYGALKSLPLAAEESAAAELSGQVALAKQLHAELAAEAASWPTSLTEDSQLLQQLQATAGSDARLAAAVQYRQQRKMLVRVGAALLQAFVDL